MITDAPRSDVQRLTHFIHSDPEQWLSATTRKGRTDDGEVIHRWAVKHFFKAGHTPTLFAA
ncbi:hypothetical protein [Methyloversatilis sp.]|uniref:hypothetical protein n=1 Tax=Methyloversatilis sp. TaxID=2569862 RepID=UPI003F70F395